MSTQFRSDLSNEYIYPRVIDWNQVVEDIHAAGLNYFGITRVLGVSWGCLQGWRRGHEPRHSTGSSLLLIHAKLCGPDLTQQRVNEAVQ